MRVASARRVSGITITFLIALALAPSAAPRDQAKPQAKPAATPAPWPDAKTTEERRKSAEGRRLFKSTQPIEFTLTANFKAVNNDRNPESTKLFPATIEFAKDDGSKITVPLQIRGRGHSRRAICTFAPLRLEFPKDKVKGTVFDGHGPLKLGTHCDNSFPDYTLREYLVYRIYNLLTPHSFRTRLAKATYVDAASKKVITTRYGMFTEDDDDVAKRLSGRISELQGLTFNRVNMEDITLMTVFAFMVGATDMSLFKQHNVQIVLTQEGMRFPIQYDFDYSGLVNAHYAVPGTGLGLVTVRDRLYRGPCHTAEEFAPVFAKTKAIRDAVWKEIDGLELPPAARADVKDFLEKYYKLIDTPLEVKRQFVDPCKGRPFM